MAAHDRCTCSMHGENVQILPPVANNNQQNQSLYYISNLGLIKKKTYQQALVAGGCHYFDST
jgi:hypothetical protein